LAQILADGTRIVNIEQVYVRTGAGADNIWGGALADTIFAGDSNDVIRGALGNDRLFGGDGDDRFLVVRILPDFSLNRDAFDRIDGGRGTDFAQIQRNKSTQGVTFSIEDPSVR
jgi:Ca2+-binding RTX toxin-like protein